MEGGHKGNNVEVEMRCGEFSNISRDVVAVVSTTKVVCEIRRQFGDGKVVHAFIESSMGCDLDLSSFNVAPENVACCVQNAAKKDPFSRVWAKFGSAMSGRANPDTTAEDLDVGEVFLFASYDCKWRF